MKTNHIISIVGTRPQFLKLAMLSKELNKHNNIIHKVIHTGQHYDNEMSEEIFNILNIQKPEYILKQQNISSINNLSNMMIEIEKILLIEKPDKIIVFGDCDSTLAGAIVAKKLKIYLIHIESGMRSYNKAMPEEIIRIMTDNISDLLLCSTSDSITNLEKENIINNVYNVGNLQLELLDYSCNHYNDISILNTNNIEKNNFILLTIHREYNTNNIMINKIFDELSKLNTKIIFPIHPRTKKIIEMNNINIPTNIILIKPVNYLDMTILERYSCFIITDSGGVQPEAWYLNKKCIIMRSETEWIEPLNNNNNILYDYNIPLNEFIDSFLKIPIIKTNIEVNKCSKLIVEYILNIFQR
jgi:UDP-GlcNAc3NAcA epimerase